jgi:hypothetical protein
MIWLCLLGCLGTAARVAGGAQLPPAEIAELGADTVTEADPADPVLPAAPALAAALPAVPAPWTASAPPACGRLHATRLFRPPRTASSR